MADEPAQDRWVVLSVVWILGAVALVGMVTLGILIDRGAEGTALALVSTPTVASITGVAALLAMSRTNPPANVQQAYTQGAQDTVAAVQAMGPNPAPVPPEAVPRVVEAPAFVVPPPDDGGGI